MPMEEVLRTVDAGIGNGVSEMVLSGGEPTLHADFSAIAGELARRGLRIGLLTTAERFAEPEFLEAVLDAVPANRLRVLTALHSFDPEVHDRMTHSAGSLQRSMSGLRHLLAAGVSLTVKHLITAPTVHALPAFTGTFLEKFPPEVHLLLCHIDYCGEAYRNRGLLAVPFSVSRPYLEAALDCVAAAARESGIWRADARVKVRDTPLCAVAPRYWAFCRSQASLKLAVYNDPTARVPKREVSNSSGPFFRECEACPVRSRCPGTWRSAESVLRPNFLPGPPQTNE